MPRVKLHVLLIGVGTTMLVMSLALFAIILRSESQVAERMETLVTRDAEVMSHSHQLKLAIVQVQQWLTDISATRGLDGLNDGFDEAAANAGRFETLLTELQTLYPAAHDRLESMRPAFADYYATGRRMAQAYIDQGPAGGNAMMASFDAAAESLAERVDPFMQEALAVVTAGHDQTDDALRLLSRATWAGLIAFTVILGFVAFVLRGVMRQVGRDPAELEAIAARIADGDLTDHERADESKATGVYSALLRMRRHLASQLDEIQDAARENGRMRSALDNASSPITVSDDDNKLIYLNASAHSLFGEVESAVRQIHKDFFVDKLVGRGIGEFFQEADVRKAYAASFTVA